MGRGTDEHETDPGGDALEDRLEDLHERSLGWARACCRWQEEEAEDVLHAVYLKVLEGRAVYGGRSQFSTWLFGVIRRTAQEQSRKRSTRRWLLLEHFSGASAQVPAWEGISIESTRLRRALAGLPGRQREVLHLVFYCDLSIREASEAMGVRLGTARVHYERGKKRLREALAGETT